MARTRGILIKLSLCGGVLVLLFLVAEVGLRIAGASPLEAAFRGRGIIVRASDHPDLVYELTPGAEGTFWDTDVRINSAGFRDREIATEKGEGVYRIAVVGDSITMGWSLPLEATYPKQLETLLEAEEPTCEVLNLGVAGYGALDEVAFFDLVGRPFDPDLVVVGYCINDVGEASLTLDYIRTVERYGGLMRLSRAYQWLALELDRIRLRREMKERSSKAGGPVTGPIASVEGDRVLEKLRLQLIDEVEEANARVEESGKRNARQYLYAWYQSVPRLGKLRLAFERLAAIAVEDGFRVVVVPIPYLDKGKDGSLRRANQLIYDIVRHEARRQDFDTIDAQPSFRRAGLSQLRKDGDLVHPNEQGHAILAEVIARWLEENRPWEGTD